MAAVFVTAIVFSSAAPAAAQATPTAFRALYIAGKSAPDLGLAEINGLRGESQPQSWKFLSLDPSARGGIREVVVSRGEVESIRTPLRGTSEIAGRTPLDRSRLKVDSDRAFQIANQEATRARIAFHWVDYTLRAEDSSEPVWKLRLFDRMGIPVATVHLSAESGAIVQPLRPEMAVEGQHSQTSPRKPVGGLLGDLRDLGLGIGKVASDTVLRTIGTGQEFLTGERTIGPTDDNLNDE